MGVSLAFLVAPRIHTPVPAWDDIMDATRSTFLKALDISRGFFICLMLRSTFLLAMMPVAMLWAFSPGCCLTKVRSSFCKYFPKLALRNKQELVDPKDAVQFTSSSGVGFACGGNA